MAKRDDFHSIDSSDGKRHFQRTTKYTSGNPSDRMRHNHISRGPEPGARGVTRSDGPDDRGSGTARDLKGPPRGPR